MLADLEKIPEESLVLFHAVGHNPTGFDPTPAQWEQILKIAKRRRFLSLFDMAYQGFVSGNPDKDAFSVQLFAKHQMPMIVVQSFAKNFGLYGQRVGCISIPNTNEEWVKKMNDWVGIRIRRLYSSNPRYGSTIVKTVLGDPLLKKQWHDDIATMSSRILEMRKLFVSAL